jgi:hypothetical protein
MAGSDLERRPRKLVVELDPLLFPGKIRRIQLKRLDSTSALSSYYSTAVANQSSFGDLDKKYGRRNGHTEIAPRFSIFDRDSEKCVANTIHDQIPKEKRFELLLQEPVVDLGCIEFSSLTHILFPSQCSY